MDVATVVTSMASLIRKPRSKKNEIRLRTRKPAKRIMVPIAKPLRQYIDSLPAGFQRGTPIHPKAFKIICQRSETDFEAEQVKSKKTRRLPSRVEALGEQLSGERVD